MIMGKLKVGLIGIGTMGIKHAEVLIHLVMLNLMQLLTWIYLGLKKLAMRLVLKTLNIIQITKIC